MLRGVHTRPMLCIAKRSHQQGEAVALLRPSIHCLLLSMTVLVINRTHPKRRGRDEKLSNERNNMKTRVSKRRRITVLLLSSTEAQTRCITELCLFKRMKGKLGICEESKKAIRHGRGFIGRGLLVREIQ